MFTVILCLQVTEVKQDCFENEVEETKVRRSTQCNVQNEREAEDSGSETTLEAGSLGDLV